MDDKLKPSDLQGNLKYACEHCDEELFDYVLSKQIIPAEDIVKSVSEAFAQFCYDGKLKEAKFLLYNEKYKPYIDPNYCNTWSFRAALFKPMPEMLEFLILEVKLKRDNTDIVIAMKNKNSAMNSICNKLFDAQELMENLKVNVPEKNIKHRKI